MLDDLIAQQCQVLETLNKSDSIKIYQRWQEIFAAKVKESTGKWKVGKLLWENYPASKFTPYYQPHYQGNKALVHYKNQQLNSFYIFSEDGNFCFKCTSNTHPEFLNGGYDLYIMPENFGWTMIFDHEGIFFFAYRPDENR